MYGDCPLTNTTDDLGAGTEYVFSFGTTNITLWVPSVSSHMSVFAALTEAPKFLHFLWQRAREIVLGGHGSSQDILAEVNLRASVDTMAGTLVVSPGTPLNSLLGKGRIHIGIARFRLPQPKRPCTPLPCPIVQVSLEMATVIRANHSHPLALQMPTGMIPMPPPLGYGYLLSLYEDLTIRESLMLDPAMTGVELTSLSLLQSPHALIPPDIQPHELLHQMYMTEANFDGKLTMSTRPSKLPAVMLKLPLRDIPTKGTGLLSRATHPHAHHQNRQKPLNKFPMSVMDVIKWVNTCLPDRWEGDGPGICKVCCENPTNVALVPCGHCLCTECALKTLGDNCSFCRQPSNCLQKFYTV